MFEYDDQAGVRRLEQHRSMHEAAAGSVQTSLYHLQMHRRIRTCVRVCMYIHVHVHVHVCVCVCVCA